MEFRLLYEGDLPGSGAQPSDKHAIRQALHPQLRRLWRTKSNLRELAFRWSIRVPPPDMETIKVDEDRFDFGIRVMGKNWSRAEYNCVPLVTQEMSLRCSLDILLLRPGDNKYLFEQGDIDNQLATLFDGLKLPRNGGDTGNAAPREDECPFFCLLEDDRLISEVHVNGDELLMLPDQRANVRERDQAVSRLNLMLYDAENKWNFQDSDKTALTLARSMLQSRTEVKAIDAFAVINVRVNHKEARTFDNFFG